MSSRLFLSPTYAALCTPEGVAFQAADHVQVASGERFRLVVQALASGPLSYGQLARALPRLDGVRQAVEGLVQAGLVLDLPAPLDPAAAQLWHTVGRSPTEAARLAASGVRLHGPEPLVSPLRSALQAWGLHDGACPGALPVVVAPTPFTPHHDQGAREPAPWALVVPEGAAAWLALFQPSAASWRDLTRRLQHNRPALALGRALPGPTALCPIAAAHVARALAQALADSPSASRWVHLAPDGTAAAHPILPVAPALPPDPEGFVSAVTGVVARPRLVDEASGGVHLATAQYRFPVAPRSLDHLREHARAIAGGKGWSPEAAIRSATFEAVEHVSGTYYPSRSSRRARARDLPGALLPDLLDLFSDAQRAHPSPPNAPLHPLTVPSPLDPGRAVEWVEAASLREGASRWIPLASAFYHPPTDGARFAFATSNGCAAGRSLPDAARRALLELVERDAVALWFYGRAPCPAVAPHHVDSPRLDGFRGHLAARGRDLWFLDATTDTRVPTAVAVSRRHSGPPGWCLGFGTGPSPARAASNAAAELAQLLPATDHLHHPSPLAWADEPALDRLPHLLPSTAAPAPPEPIPLALSRLVDHLGSLGLQAYAVDQTHPLVGVPVVRAVVPGLVHFWRRLGAPRLYDVPLETGRRARRLDEREIPPLDLTV